jgi:predicted nucleic acid-binding Zn ribbon protein
MDCHQNTLQRIIQVSAILFKGSGWYCMDHRSRNGQTPGTFKSKGFESGTGTLQTRSSGIRQATIKKNKNGVLK